MREFELYVPLLDNDGRAVPGHRIDELKEELRERFGGFTYFPQESEGEWETGGRQFRDRIVILRVLTADEEALAWFGSQKERLAREFGQADFLITVKAVQAV